MLFFNGVLNSDLWKQAIKVSPYWSLVYTTVYIIHAGALETITIDGVYGSFTTNSDGNASHALPLGELTLIGSISGQSFTRAVTSDTTEVYVMPEGALYWYGNMCKWIIGSWTIRDPNSTNDVYEYGTNYLYHKSNYTYSSPCIWSDTPVDLTNYNTLSMIRDSNSGTSVNSGNNFCRISLPKHPFPDATDQVEIYTTYVGDGLKTQTADISDKKGEYHIRPWGCPTNVGGKGIYTYFYAVWLE